jgi:hypothetical protein
VGRWGHVRHIGRYFYIIIHTSYINKKIRNFLEKDIELFSKRYRTF